MMEENLDFVSPSMQAALSCLAELIASGRPPEEIFWGFFLAAFATAERAERQPGYSSLDVLAIALERMKERALANGVFDHGFRQGPLQ